MELAKAVGYKACTYSSMVHLGVCLLCDTCRSMLSVISLSDTLGSHSAGLVCRLFGVDVQKAIWDPHGPKLDH